MVTRWNVNVNTEEQEKAVERVKPILLRLTPDWVNEIHVVLTNEDDCLLQVMSDYEYRRIKIELAPRWFGQSHELQERDVFHELVHPYLLPFGDVCELVLAKYAKKEEIVHDLYERGMEQTTEDLSELIWRLYKKVDTPTLL